VRVADLLSTWLTTWAQASRATGTGPGPCPRICVTST
jgi:hypothetical protein